MGLSAPARASEGLRSPPSHGLFQALLALIVSSLFAASGPGLLDLSFGQLWLAYTSGGVEAMAAIALVLNLEPPFIGGHRIVRILGLNLVAPFWFRPTPPPSP